MNPDKKSMYKKRPVFVETKWGPYVRPLKLRTNKGVKQKNNKRKLTFMTIIVGSIFYNVKRMMRKKPLKTPNTAMWTSNCPPVRFPCNSFSRLHFYKRFFIAAMRIRLKELHNRAQLKRTSPFQSNYAFGRIIHATPVFRSTFRFHHQWLIYIRPRSFLSFCFERSS